MKDSLHIKMSIIVHNRYKLNPNLDAIGHGSFGIVYKAIDIETNGLVALKVVDINKNNDNMVEVLKKLEIEAKLMETLNHPRIARGIEHFNETFLGAESMIFVM
jgi:serine/threonine protein kinase